MVFFCRGHNYLSKPLGLHMLHPDFGWVSNSLSGWFMCVLPFICWCKMLTNIIELGYRWYLSSSLYVGQKLKGAERADKRVPACWLECSHLWQGAIHCKLNILAHHSNSPVLSNLWSYTHLWPPYLPSVAEVQFCLILQWILQLRAWPRSSSSP